MPGTWDFEDFLGSLTKEIFRDPSPKTTTVQPEHHTTDTTEQSIQSEFQSGVNQPGVNSDNDSISDL